MLKLSVFLWVLCYNEKYMRRYDKLLGIWKEINKQETARGYRKPISPYTLLVKMGVSVYEYNKLQDMYLAGTLPSDDERSFVQKLSWCIDDLMAQWHEMALSGRANPYAVEKMLEHFNRTGFVSERKRSTMEDRIKKYQKLQQTAEKGETDF